MQDDSPNNAVAVFAAMCETLQRLPTLPPSRKRQPQHVDPPRITPTPPAPPYLWQHHSQR